MRLSELAELIGGTLHGDAGLEIAGVAGLDDAREGDVSFVLDDKHMKAAASSAASCLLVKQHEPSVAKAQVVVGDPQAAFIRLLATMRPRPAWPSGISPLAYVDAQAALGEGVTVMPFAYISAGARIGARTVICPGVFVGQGSAIGEGSLLYPNVAVMDGCAIGRRAIIHAGVVIGSDGFGFIQRKGENIKVPQAGGVEIGDDVEIGANSCIDRATTGTTRIGSGTKIDNLVQVAHNVEIGEGAILAAFAGIAGSSKVGRRSVLAARAGVGDHVKLADGVTLTAMAGTTSDIEEPGYYSGFPVMPMRDWLKAMSALRRLPELAKRVGELEKRLADNETRGDGK